MTKDQFLSFYPNNKNASICYDAIDSALTEFCINTPLTMIGALATCRTEVGKYFKPIKEFSTGREYEGNTSLGNTEPGDGHKFIGRGFIQLTGRWNYKHFGDKLGLDLINNPDLLLDVTNSARVMALFFKERNIDDACNLKLWLQVRRLVNGGSTGLDTFLNVVKQYIERSSR